jgi:NitT/TauT family transport system permease protein
VVPFIALLCTYLVGSHIRTAENPDDKLLPTPATIASTMHSYAVEEDVRSGEVLFWVDTLASLERIAIALVLSATIGLVLGLAIGAVPVVRAALAPFVGAVAMIPPLAVLPILFILLGLGRLRKSR